MQNTTLFPVIAEDIEFAEVFNPNTNKRVMFLEVSLQYENDDEDDFYRVSYPKFEKFCNANNLLELTYEETCTETGYTSTYTVRPAFEQFLRDSDYKVELRKALESYVRPRVRGLSQEVRMFNANVYLAKENMALLKENSELKAKYQELAPAMGVRKVG